jgi:hypothetical protein
VLRLLEPKVPGTGRTFACSGATDAAAQLDLNVILLLACKPTVTSQQHVKKCSMAVLGLHGNGCCCLLEQGIDEAAIGSHQSAPAWVDLWRTELH